MNRARALAEKLPDLAPSALSNALEFAGPGDVTARVELSADGYVCRFDLTSLSGPGRTNDPWVAWSIELRRAVAQAWPAVEGLPRVAEPAEPEPEIVAPPLEHDYAIGPSICMDLAGAHWRAHRDGLLSLVQSWDGPAISWRAWARPAAVALGAERGWDNLPDVIPHDFRHARKIARILERAAQTLDLPRGIEALDLRGLPDNVAIDFACATCGTVAVTNAYVAITVSRSA